MTAFQVPQMRWSARGWFGDSVHKLAFPLTCFVHHSRLACIISFACPQTCEGNPVVCRYHVSPSTKFTLYKEVSSGARHTVSSSRTKNLSTSFSLCWMQDLLVILRRATSITVMFAWGAQLRSSVCAYTSALLWMIYSLYPTSLHWLPDAPWLGRGATVSWPTRSAPYPSIKVKWMTSRTFSSLA